MAEEPATVEEDSRPAETADGRESRYVNLSQLLLMHASCQVGALFGAAKTTVGLIELLTWERWGPARLLREAKSRAGA